MKVRNFKGLKLVICLVLACAQSSALLLEAQNTDTTDSAAKSQHGSHKKVTPAKTLTGAGKSLGLDSITLKLVNKGEFAKVIERLKPRTEALSAPNREAAWLAFCYLYLGQCDSLKSLSDSCKAPTTDDLNSTLIQSFDLLCQKKENEAEKKLQQISAAAMNDAFVNYAFATVAGKQGKAAISVTYIQRATELAPQFAWGFRTMGFLQQRKLNAPLDAEASYGKALQIEPDLSEAVNTLVDLKLAHNDFDGAIAVAENALKREHGSAATHYLLAQIYMRQWRLLEAAAQLQRAITLEPQNAKYYRSRAALLRYQGKLAQAITDQTKVVELDTDKALDLIDLSSMEIAAGQETQAIEHLKQTLAIDPANKQASEQLVKLLAGQGKFAELAVLFRQLVDKNPKSEILRLKLAEALVGSGKMEAAIEEYKQAANLNPSDPDPHRRIAAIYIAQKNFKSAAASYTRALNINSNSVPDLVSLGFCYAQTDDYLQAEAALVTALALHQLTQPADSQVPPTRVDIIRSLATLLYQEGRYADAAGQFVTVCSLSKGTPTENTDAFMQAQANALRDRSIASFQDLKTAFEKLPATEQAQQKLNYIDTLISGQCWDKADSLLPQIETDKVTDPFIAILWSRVWRSRGDLAKAEESAQRAVSNPAQAGTPLSDALCELSEVLLAKGDLAAAGKNAQRALEINAKSFRAFDLLGRIALKRGDFKMAIEAANKALEIDPYYTEAYLLLGDAQSAGNHLKEASVTYQKAVDLYPGLLEAHQSLLNVLRKLSLPDEIKKEEAVINQLNRNSVQKAANSVSEAR